MDNPTQSAEQSEFAVVKYQGPKHTSGPWGYWPYDDSELDSHEPKYCVGDVFESGTGFIADVMSEADARLIAAAPDMLAALEAINDCSEHNELPWRIKDALYAAIAKATQRT